MKKNIQTLTSIPFLIVLLLVFVLILAGGSLLPLELAVEQLYNSIILKVVVFILFIVLIICITTQYKSFSEKRIYFIIHLALIIILSGGFISAFFSTKAFMQLHADETSYMALKENHDKLVLPFKVKLKSFTIEKYNQQPEIILKFLDKDFKTISQHPVFKKATIAIPENSETLKIAQIKQERESITNILLDVNGYKRWVGTNDTAYLLDEINGIYIYFENKQNNHIKSFKSNIEIIKKGNKITSFLIEVNKPCIIDGYKLYQYSYDKENRKWSGIMIKKDPGVPVVYAGYLMLVLGIVLNLLETLTRKEEYSNG